MCVYVVTTQIVLFVVSSCVTLLHGRLITETDRCTLFTQTCWLRQVRTMEHNLLMHCHMLISNNNETLMDVCRLSAGVSVWVQHIWLIKDKEVVLKCYTEEFKSSNGYFKIRQTVLWSWRNHCFWAKWTNLVSEQIF